MPVCHLDRQSLNLMLSARLNRIDARWSLPALVQFSWEVENLHTGAAGHAEVLGLVGGHARRFTSTPVVRFPPIVFSNGSRGKALPVFDALGMPVFSARALAFDGVKCRFFGVSGR
jgi:hypothetical protein